MDSAVLSRRADSKGFKIEDWRSVEYFVGEKGFLGKGGGGWGGGDGK